MSHWNGEASLAHLIEARRGPHAEYKRWDALPPALTKSRSRKKWVSVYAIVLKFDRFLGIYAAQASVKFQGDKVILQPNLTG